LANEYREELQAAGVPEYLYEVKEGDFSCYIDAVDKKIAPSSYCSPEEMLDIQFNPYDENAISLTSSLATSFQTF
jgi:hypothetical protein